MSSQNTTLLLISLVSILLIALLVNYFIYQQQERTRQRSILAKKLRYDAGQLLDTLSTLKQLQCTQPVIDLLNNEVVEMLSKLAQLSPKSTMIEQIQSQIPMAAEDAGSLNVENDSSMKKAHAAIRFAIRFVHQRRSLGGLSSIKCDEISRELQWLDSKIDIDTHIAVGKRLVSSDKAVLATSRFKLAKNVIARLPHKDPRRQELLNEINELIAEALPFATPATVAEIKSDTDSAT